MKKKLIFPIMALMFFSLSSCEFAQNYYDKFISLDTYIEINFRCSKNGKEHLKNIKNIYNDVNIASDNYESRDGKSVYDLNHNRELELTDTLKALLEKSIEAKEKTNGYYNPLIGRLSIKWKEAIERKSFVENEVVSQELEIMNNSDIIIENNKATLIGDADIDLGGIAKGYATELVHQYLIDNNINDYLINSGESNILTSNRDTEYKIGLSKPFDDELYGILYVKDKSIATSSPKYKRTENDGVLYHHILSPFTGMPINNFESVNVICDNSMDADVYSTAIFVMDIEEAKKFADDKNIEIILCKDGQIIYQKLGERIEKI